MHSGACSNAPPRTCARIHTHTTPMHTCTYVSTHICTHTQDGCTENLAPCPHLAFASLQMRCGFSGCGVEAWAEQAAFSNGAMNEAPS